MRFHALILLFLCSALTAPAAQTIPFTVYLSGDQVPLNSPVPQYGYGRILLTGDTLVFDFSLSERRPPVLENPHGTNRPPPVVLPPWHVTVHGPAAAGSNAPVVFDLGICGQTNTGFSAASVIIIAPTNPGQNPRPTPPAPPRPPIPAVPPCELSDVHGISPAEKKALWAGLLYVEAEGFGARIRGQILLADSDGDGVPDYLDECPDTSADSLVTRDGCSLEQLAPCDGPWKNHGQFVKAFKEATKSFVEEGLITHKAKKELDKEAAHSDCGKNR